MRCDNCNGSFTRTLKIVRSTRKRKGQDIDHCSSCAARLALKPQQTKQYWTLERKREHSFSIKSSAKYYKAISSRPSVSGHLNPRFGVPVLDETRKKMSESRKGKTGEKATAWKGGKFSLNRRVRHALNSRVDFGWYRKVYKRDNWKCVECGSTKKIDAHHIRPLSVCIREARIRYKGTSELEFEWLLTQDQVIDLNLTNGKTLCRECHRKVHQNKWGSHEQ